MPTPPGKGPLGDGPLGAPDPEIDNVEPLAPLGGGPLGDHALGRKDDEEDGLTFAGMEGVAVTVLVGELEEFAHALAGVGVTVETGSPAGLMATGDVQAEPATTHGLVKTHFGAGSEPRRVGDDVERERRRRQKIRDDRRLADLAQIILARERAEEAARFEAERQRITDEVLVIAAELDRARRDREAKMKQNLAVLLLLAA
ncbi:MAG: hypothetical protein ACRECF_09280 [Methyloceanibacter sp.]